MRRRLTTWGIAALAVVGLTAVACGDTVVETSLAGGEGISVSGIGRVAVEPDVGVINLGVEVSADTVARARGGATEAMQEIRDSLDDNGVEERDITTRFFNIFPQFDFDNRRGQPEIIGFTVSNQIEIKVRDIDRISEILDEAIEAGGNAIRVNGIRFEVDEPEQFFEEARRLAVEDARTRAEQLADLAGVELGKVRTISESSGSISPQFFAEDRAIAIPAAGGGATSISPGEGEIVLTVFVVYATK